MEVEDISDSDEDDDGGGPRVVSKRKRDMKKKAFVEIYESKEDDSKQDEDWDFDT